ncbi:myb-like dna-binding [Plasmopara halstedii]|uniref:Myb-like dna-binding n=1 Tax=Plasmopara halstedii TaxID=4781 RepID=A0A0P1ABR4_PLAHL|nr:myb-like dna-binding [Plasmopara halstedii]CEG38108.1 myb-like dna-binding [Plasmopara halstedii]|eukprot:XP_024574477.1 myb-like dna-binding [Plasmopara halstedii]
MCTKRQRIERLIQRGHLLANVQRGDDTETGMKACMPLSRNSICTPAAPFQPRRSSWTPEEDEKLKKLVHQLGSCNWSEIALAFPSRNRKRCRERFENHLKPSVLASGTWSKEDDLKVLQLLRTLGPKWAEIARKMICRSAESVKNRCLLLARKAVYNKKAPLQRWSATEKEKLRSLVATHGAQNWLFIASQLPGRTDLQCLQQWSRTLNDKIVRGKGTWTQNEDRILVQKVAEFGRKWTAIAAYLPGRLGIQCRERYLNHLDPSIKTTPWTNAEDQILSEAIAKHSTQWVLIAKKLPGRKEED